MKQVSVQLDNMIAKQLEVTVRDNGYCPKRNTLRRSTLVNQGSKECRWEVRK